MAVSKQNEILHFKISRQTFYHLKNLFSNLIHQLMNVLDKHNSKLSPWESLHYAHFESVCIRCFRQAQRHAESSEMVSAFEVPREMSSLRAHNS